MEDLNLIANQFGEVMEGKGVTYILLLYKAEGDELRSICTTNIPPRMAASELFVAALDAYNAMRDRE